MILSGPGRKENTERTSAMQAENDTKSTTNTNRAGMGPILHLKHQVARRGFAHETRARTMVRQRSALWRFSEQLAIINRGSNVEDAYRHKTGIMDAVADMTARLTKLMNTPGISEKVRKHFELQLRAQERHKKKIERLLGRC
jgi:hypothetical protein